jgi:protein O-mannosyl-transferase
MIIPPVRFKNLFPYVLLIIAVGVAYANVYGNGFFGDDDVLILENLYVRNWGSLGELLTSSIARGSNIGGAFYRPMQSLLYLIVYHIAGYTPITFHLLNVVLHGANACLVFALGRKLGFHKIAVFFAALIWAVHPVNVEAVTYLSATADTLFTFFCIVGIVVLLPDFTPRKIALTLPLFALGLLSKETSVVFPLLAMSCLFLVSKQRLKPKTYACTWPLWFIAALYVLAREAAANFALFDIYRQHYLDFYFQYADYSQNIFYRIYTFLATMPSYAKLLIWPTDLHPLRSFPVFEAPWHSAVLAGFVLVAGACAQIVWGRGKRGLALSWGLLWFFAANILHSGILMPINGIFMEHWMYLPALGLFLGVGESVAQALHTKRRQLAAATAALVFAAMFGVVTFVQNRIWRDPETLCARIIASHDYLPNAHEMLGSFYFKRGKSDKALQQYALAIQKSGDTLPNAQYNTGIVLFSTSDEKTVLNEAAGHFKRALEINPDLFPASHYLAQIYVLLGDEEKETFYRNQTKLIRDKVTARYRPRE